MRIEFTPSPQRMRSAQTTDEQWQDWSWQLRHSLKSEKQFAEHFNLVSQEQQGFQGESETFSVRATPYYASLASAENSHDPIRKILMPTQQELGVTYQEMTDPLGEKQNSPVKRIIHRYSDRVLFLITDICSVYCRYCTRKYFTAQDQAMLNNQEFTDAISYIKSKPGIREVILSGGDPLTVSNSQLERVLQALRAIEHVEIIRIGTRMPVVCPMRIDEDLVKMLRRYKPVFLMTHFNHPKELTLEAAQAVELFVDHGVPVFNQMVLLNGINNHPAVVQALSRRLLYLRAKPYYMFQCDPSRGTDHLRTSIEDSLSIQRQLWGHLSGLAMPHLSVDIPQGGGKMYYTPSFETSQHENIRYFKGWDGVEAAYISPHSSAIIKPVDAELYFTEWEQLRNSKS